MYVKFNGNGRREAMQSDVRTQQHNWVLIKKQQVLFGLRKNKQQPFGKRAQFPLTFSLVCAVHKVEDFSLAEGVVSFDFEKQKVLKSGANLCCIKQDFKYE